MGARRSVDRPVREVLAGILESRGRAAQAELARKLDVDPDMVSRWVGRAKTKTTIKADDVPPIAQALGVSICDLYGVPEGHQVQPIDPKLKIAEVLGVEPERVEVYVYPVGTAKHEDLFGQRRPRREHIQRRLHEEWPLMSEEERQEWRELAKEIRQMDEEQQT